MSNFPPAAPAVQINIQYPPQQFQNLPPNQNIAPHQPNQNFSNQQLQGMGDFHNAATGYPPSGYPPQHQPHTSPGYPPQQQPHTSPGYLPQQQIPGYPPQQQPHTSPGYPPQQQPQINPGYPSQPTSPPAPGIQPAVNPSAPDMSNMLPMPGYEGLTFEQTVLVPPSVPEWMPDPGQKKTIESMPPMSEDEVRDAAIQYASEHCCYGSAPVKNMVLLDLQMSSASHYKLETFTEKRESAWKFEPYKGQPVDGPQNGAPPSPWEVMVIPDNYFANSKVNVEVPHTAFTRPCHSCVGNGRIRCENCFGNGRKQCTWCKGKGRSNRENCSSCGGTGFDRCYTCSGTGQVNCKTCDSRGNLKGFVELTVTWVNHVDNFITEVECMPKELVLEVSGQTAYEEENPRVFPIVQGAEDTVCKASSDLIKKHGSSFNNERILKQRQQLRIVPVSQVKYEWKGKVDNFCVYGFEHKVYFKEYPQKCCCCVIS